MAMVSLPPPGPRPALGKNPRPQLGWGRGWGLEMNPRAGMRTGTRINFHLVPSPLPRFGRYPIPILTFPSPIREKSPPPFLFIRF